MNIPRETEHSVFNWAEYSDVAHDSVTSKTGG